MQWAPVDLNDLGLPFKAEHLPVRRRFAPSPSQAVVEQTGTTKALIDAALARAPNGGGMYDYLLHQFPAMRGHVPFREWFERLANAAVNASLQPESPWREKNP